MSIGLACFCGREGLKFAPGGNAVRDVRRRCCAALQLLSLSRFEVNFVMVMADLFLLSLGGKLKVGRGVASYRAISKTLSKEMCSRLFQSFFCPIYISLKEI